MKKIFLSFMCLSSFAFADSVYAIFNAVAVKDADLAMGTGGVVSEISVDVGDEVKRGDKLLSLFSADQKAQLDSIYQQYEFNKKQHERYKRLKGVVDQNTLDRYETDYKRYEADLKYYEAMLSKSTLRAPFDGIIAEKNIELGDGVSANSTKLLRLISKEVKIILEFDFKYLPKVQLGDRFEFTIDGGNTKQVAIINKIYPTANTTNRKVKAEALVQNVVPGSFGDGFIQTKNEVSK